MSVKIYSRFDSTRVVFDFSGDSLRGANLSGADLIGANLHGANIPVIPNIDRAILAAVQSPGCALDMAMWHTCETTHCRAGWAIHLAGDAGRALEAKLGSATAGSLIYAVSRPDKRIPDFYASTEAAMADLIDSARGVA